MQGFSSDALDLLAAHDYPGNVRELQNEVERAFMLADGETLIAADLLSEKIRARRPRCDDGQWYSAQRGGAPGD